MMKIFKSQKPAVCGTAKRPIRRWLLPPKKAAGISLLFHCSFSCLRAVPSFSTRIIKAHLLMNQGDLLFPFKGGMDYDL